VNRLILGVLVAFLSLGLAGPDADAARLGSGRTQGIQRQRAPAPAPAQTPPQAAKPGAAAAATPPVAPAPAAPRRSWLGPVAGLAAGLGIAALMSHFGMGAELGNGLTLLLLAAGGFFALRWLMARFGGGAAAARGAGGASGASGLAWANGGGSAGAPVFTPVTPLLPAAAAAAPAASASVLPAGFDAAGFERSAKMIFIRMQAANDARNLDDLRQFSTPEMYAAFRLDLQDRHGAPQQTDVVQLDAQVLAFEHDAGRQIVSVRFSGLIREDREAAAAPFDEVWHLVRPDDESRDWAIGGIAQNTAA